MTTPEDMPYKIALIIDGVVEQILYSNQEDAAKFLSEPTFKEIPTEENVVIGSTFDGSTFTAPANPSTLPEIPTVTEVIEGDVPPEVPA